MDPYPQVPLLILDETSLGVCHRGRSPLGWLVVEVDVVAAVVVDTVLFHCSITVEILAVEGGGHRL